MTTNTKLNELDFLKMADTLNGSVASVENSCQTHVNLRF